MNRPVSGDQSKLAVGSTPNLAARLQGLAAADQIVIAASTRRLVGNAFELTDLGEHDLKGIAEPVHAWRVERALVTESRFDASRGGSALTPLVGRDEELDLLLRRWSQARDGEGQVVLLSGEPGIGKSRILSALRERLEAQGVQALRFQCSPYYVNSAFWPIIDNLERTLKFSRDETTDSKLDKLEALIVTHYGRPLADVRFVASILSIPCEQRYGALTMTPQRHKDETLRTLVDLIEAAARQQPSVMLFEDAHWADPTTLEVLDLLIDRVRTVPLLVVLTHRPEFQSRWSGQGHVGALNLSKLTRTQSAAMVSTLAGGKALPAALLEKILTRTDGVPLFVEESNIVHVQRIAMDLSLVILRPLLIQGNNGLRSTRNQQGRFMLIKEPRKPYQREEVVYSLPESLIVVVLLKREMLSKFMVFMIYLEKER